MLQGYVDHELIYDLIPNTLLQIPFGRPCVRPPFAGEM